MNHNLNSESLVVISIALAATAMLWIFRHHRSAHSPPPGPRGYPIIGNLLDLPPLSQNCVTFAKWGEIYGTSQLSYHSCSSTEIVQGIYAPSVF